LIFSHFKTEDMSDKEALRKITAMLNDYVNNPKEGLLNPKAERLINNLKKVTEKLGFEPNNTYIYINKKI